MLKLDMGDEKRSIVERLLGEAKRDLALDGLEKTAIAAFPRAKPSAKAVV